MSFWEYFRKYCLLEPLFWLSILLTMLMVEKYIDWFPWYISAPAAFCTGFLINQIVGRIIERKHFRED